MIVQKIIHSDLAYHRNLIKKKRISTWKIKMADGARNKQIAKCVFQWIKRKSTIALPNLIRDQNGDIIYSPAEAIKEINNVWDDIYSANVLYEDPQKVLSFIWPYIQHVHQKIDAIPLTGAD